MFYRRGKEIPKLRKNRRVTSVSNGEERGLLVSKEEELGKRVCPVGNNHAEREERSGWRRA